MYNKISHYLKASNIQVPEQSGFRKGISTENGAFKLTDCILKSLNQKMCAGGIFCDLVKGIDCANHEILLPTLRYFGIKGSMANWFKFYLRDRKQMIEIKSPYTTRNTYPKLWNNRAWNRTGVYFTTFALHYLYK
jgi:hypothetical protein